MHKICQNCEHRILAECPGLDDENILTTGCFLENVYGLATNSEQLALQENTYNKSPADWTPEERHEVFLRDVIGLDVHINGVRSELYPFWNLRRNISVLHQLEIYQLLNVNLTLKDYDPESFYAGMPKPTAKDIRIVKKLLDKPN